jgi:uncharacterized alkaline shock family protein YloU
LVDRGESEMSESEGQRYDSPLLSERGATIISSTVVSSITGMAAQEVEGVHMGGGTSRTASGVIGSITGSESKTSGISVEVGRIETAIDLKMGIEYNKNILETVEEVRRRVTDRIHEITGLRIKELNATITDITFPEREERRRLGSGRSASQRDDTPEDSTDAAPETQAEPESEPGERETTQVETTSQTRTEAPSVPEEEAGTEERTLEEDETAEVRTEEQPADEAAETPEETRAETGTSEQEDAEARMRRRAEERARRRRRRTEDS